MRKPKSLLRDSLKSVHRNTWLVLVVLGLGLLLLADRFYPPYRERMDDRADAVMRAERAQALADVLPKFQAKLDADNARAQPLIAQSFIHDNPEQSLAQFRERVDAAIRESGISGTVNLNAESDATGQSAVLSLTAQFQSFPQQLTDLEQRLLALPWLVHVSAIEIKVMPNTPDGVPQLSVVMTLKALHAPPDVTAQ